MPALAIPDSTAMVLRVALHAVPTLSLAPDRPTALAMQATKGWPAWTVRLACLAAALLSTPEHRYRWHARPRKAPTPRVK